MIDSTPKTSHSNGCYRKVGGATVDTAYKRCQMVKKQTCMFAAVGVDPQDEMVHNIRERESVLVQDKRETRFK